MRYKSVPALKGQKLSAIGFGTWSLGGVFRVDRFK